MISVENETSRPGDELMKCHEINVKHNTGESVMKQAITYDRKVQTIRAEGKIIVDLSSVKDGSKAILYSRGAEQDSAFETTFRFYENTTFPFFLDALPMTPAALIRTIVENRLQVEGLVCLNEITSAYQTIITTQISDILTVEQYHHTSDKMAILGQSAPKFGMVQSYN